MTDTFALMASKPVSREQRLTATVARWRETVRSTQPLSRAAAAEAVGALYRAAGRPDPAIVFLSSPLACICAWRVLSCQWDGVVEPLGRLIKADLKPGLGRTSVHERLRRIRACLDGSVAQQLAAPLVRLGDPLLEIETTMQEMLRREARMAWQDLEGEVWKRLEDEDCGFEPALRARLLQRIERLKVQQATAVPPPPLHAACWGAWDCLSEALDDCIDQLGLTGEEAGGEASGLRAQAWVRQAQSCHFWLPLKGLALLSERPCVMSLDARDQLHGENEAAVRYRDGCALYAWHGVRVHPRLIVDPGSITLAEIENPGIDAELRRIKIARYGEGRYLKDAGAELIHQDERGRLWRKERRGDTPLVMVEVRNATPEPDGSVKTFLLRVPPDIRCASDAVAWTFGMDATRYAPALET